MFVARWIKVAAVLLVAGATVTGVELLSRSTASGIEPATQNTAQPGPGFDIPVAEVKSGRFKVSVVEMGSLEAARRTDLICLIEGGTTIMSILPEGTKVKKGDLVCELDSASLKDQLTNQKIASQGAEAALQNAKIARGRRDRGQGI